MVEDEKKRYRPTKNYLENLPPTHITAFEVNEIYFILQNHYCVCAVAMNFIIK